MRLMLVVQIATFVGLGVWFLSRSEWRLGVAQLLLAGVQGLIYS